MAANAQIAHLQSGLQFANKKKAAKKKCEETAYTKPALALYLIKQTI